MPSDVGQVLVAVAIAVIVAKMLDDGGVLMGSGSINDEIVIIAGVGLDAMEDVAQSGGRFQIERRVVDDVLDPSGWNVASIDGRVFIGIEFNYVIVESCAARRMASQIEISMVAHIDWCRTATHRRPIDNQFVPFRQPIFTINPTFRHRQSFAIDPTNRVSSDCYCKSTVTYFEHVRCFIMHMIP